MKRKVFAAVGAACGIGLVVVLIATVVAQRNELVPSGPKPTLPAGASAFEVIRPFSPEVAWNRPVSEFGRSERYAEYADRFWQYGSFGGWDEPERRDDIQIEFRDYSVPMYDARTATETKTVYIANFGYPPSPGYSMDIPWNPYWQAAPGNDAIVMMLDPDTGEEWSVWALQRGNPSTCITPDNLRAGFRPFTDFCAGGVSRLTNEDGSVGDYRTWNSYDNERGNGLPKLATITTPYEVRAGVIEHALEMTVFNTMFGLPCTDAEIGTAAMGDTCGFYVPPATRVEWHDRAPTDCGANNQPSTPEYRRKTVPHGMRFALDIADAEIEAWLDDRGYTGAKRSTARIFAVALRDYGWIISETGCYGMSIEVDGFVNPEAQAIWKDLGIDDDEHSDRLLEGLFTRDRIYVVEPPEPAPMTRAPSAGMAR